MSAVKIVSALQKALASVTPTISTVLGNAGFTPVAGEPYQKAFVLFAPPDDPEMGNTFHREQGILQVSLFYPLGAGEGAALARAELLRSTFYRGAAFNFAGVAVIIERTPAIASGTVEGDRWMLPVKIRFYSNIT